MTDEPEAPPSEHTLDAKTSHLIGFMHGWVFASNPESSRDAGICAGKGYDMWRLANKQPHDVNLFGIAREAGKSAARQLGIPVTDTPPAMREMINQCCAELDNITDIASRGGNIGGNASGVT